MRSLSASDTTTESLSVSWTGHVPSWSLVMVLRRLISTCFSRRVIKRDKLTFQDYSVNSFYFEMEDIYNVSSHSREQSLVIAESILYNFSKTARQPVHPGLPVAFIEHIEVFAIELMYYCRGR